MFLSAESVQRLACQQFASGAIPRTMSLQGYPDAEGPILVDTITTRLTQNVIALRWDGRSSSGAPAAVEWQMGFVDTPDGLVLGVATVTVNGKVVPTPEQVRLVNPIDELIKNIAFGHVGKALFYSPLGRVKITTGGINSAGILVAGRA
jgi:hypothetical protein